MRSWMLLPAVLLLGCRQPQTTSDAATHPARASSSDSGSGKIKAPSALGGPSANASNCLRSAEDFDENGTGWGEDMQQKLELNRRYQNLCLRPVRCTVELSIENIGGEAPTRGDTIRGTASFDTGPLVVLNVKVPTEASAVAAGKRIEKGRFKEVKKCEFAGPAMINLAWPKDDPFCKQLRTAIEDEPRVTQGLLNKGPILGARRGCEMSDEVIECWYSEKRSQWQTDVKQLVSHMHLCLPEMATWRMDDPTQLSETVRFWSASTPRKIEVSGGGYYEPVGDVWIHIFLK